MTKHNDQLLPCPFCGTNDLLGFEPCHEGGWTVVKCRKCGCSGSTGRPTSEAEAVVYWNRRAQLPTAGVVVPEVERFEFEGGCVVEDSTGDYVRWEDYEALRAMLAAAPHPVSGEHGAIDWAVGDQIFQSRSEAVKYAAGKLMLVRPRYEGGQS